MGLFHRREPLDPLKIDPWASIAAEDFDEQPAGGEWSLSEETFASDAKKLGLLGRLTFSRSDKPKPGVTTYRDRETPDQIAND